MTLHEKETVRRMRIEGSSYKSIAAVLSLSENTIKSFCQRNRLNGIHGAAISRMKEAPAVTCKQCGSPLHQNSKLKPRKFCTDSCRRAWWKKHGDSKNRKAFYLTTCAGCNVLFRVYGNSHRKYCSHNCYIKARFMANIEINNT